MKRVAVADVGTNTVLLLVAEAGEGLRPLLDLSRTPRLGQGMLTTGHLSEEAMERALRVLQEYGEVAQEHEAERIAVGTQALREAANGPAFLERAERETGWRIRVLRHEEEALYTYRGVRTGAGRGKGRLLVYDIGGGSTEIIYGKGDTVLWSVSVPLGVVWLTERYFHSDPPSPASLEAVRGEIRQRLAGIAWPEEVDDLIGVGGTPSTLAMMQHGWSTYREEVEQVRLSQRDVAGHLEQLAPLPIEERKRIPGLPPDRADIIVAGALIVEGILEACGRSETGVSGRGVRYGVAWTRFFLPEEREGAKCS